MSLNLVVASLVLLPFVMWGLSEALFWCFCWCFCKVEGYFQDRFMKKLLRNMDKIDRMRFVEEKASAA